MLCSLRDVLPALEGRRACLAGFDIGGGQSDFLLGVLRTCQGAGSPALMLVWAPGATYLGLEACADLVCFYAARSPVPVILHLDHARSEQEVARALDLGFKSVMFDGSDLPFEENARRTKAMAALAHAHGATAEGELGRLGQEQANGKGAVEFTRPEEAAEFVRRTGIDLLAPAVGNAHGFYRRPVALRFDLIAQIASAAGVPLSLHGGTGIPFADVRRAAGLGVRKMNVASQLHRDFTDALRAALPATEGRQYSWRKALDAGRAAIAALVAGYVRELGTGGLM